MRETQRIVPLRKCGQGGNVGARTPKTSPRCSCSVCDAAPGKPPRRVSPPGRGCLVRASHRTVRQRHGCLVESASLPPHESAGATHRPSRAPRVSDDSGSGIPLAATATTRYAAAGCRLCAAPIRAGRPARRGCALPGLPSSRCHFAAEVASSRAAADRSAALGQTPRSATGSRQR